MTQNSNALKHTIIGTLVGGLLLSFVLWLVGFLPTVWSWLVAAINKLWLLVVSDITIPLWSFVILLILSLPLIWRLSINVLSRFLPNKDAPLQTSDINSENNNQQQLSSNESLALQALASADGNSLHIDSVAKLINQNQLRTEQALDSLIDKGLVDYSLNYLYGTSYYLSENGRDLVIELGYA